MTPFGTKVRLERLAARQGGRVHHDQISRVGASRDAVRHWRANRTLIPTAPWVYALGYVRTDRIARIWDALLYAGPGAGLTGACGAYQLGLLFHEPPFIEVSTPHQRRRPLQEAIILERRRAGREIHAGLPYVPLPDLLLELAHRASVPMLRRALETLDFRRMLDLSAVRHACGRGRPGSQRLGQALTRRLPELARTRSPLEVDFLLLLEAHHLPIPLVNERLHGVEADMHWPELKLVVELDGAANHHSPAQKRRDQARDAHLHAHDITVIRLGFDDVHHAAAATLTRLAEHGLTATQTLLRSQMSRSPVRVSTGST